jgi:hypothetical protein
MSSIDHLLRVADLYGSALSLERSTVSWRIFGDTKKLPAIHAGADIQVKRLERAMQFLSDNWPEGAEWPAEIARPQQSARSAA